MPRLHGIAETVKEVVRVQVEGGQTLFLNYGTRPFHLLQERPITLLNLIVAPDGCDWKPRGRTGKLLLLLGDKPMYQAPIEFLMAEWQRYQVGVPQFFREMILPVRQSVSLCLEDTRLPAIVDMPITYKRDVV